MMYINPKKDEHNGLFICPLCGDIDVSSYYVKLAEPYIETGFNVVNGTDGMPYMFECPHCSHVARQRHINLVNPAIYIYNEEKEGPACLKPFKTCAGFYENKISKYNPTTWSFDKI